MAVRSTLERLAERWSRLRWVPRGPLGFVALGFLALVVAAGVGFGPVVRGRVQAMATARGVDARVGSVAPGWFSVTLSDVDARPEGVDGVHATVREATVKLSVFLRPREIEVQGVHVALDGTRADLEERLAAWRDRRGGARAEAPRSEARASPRLVGSGVSFAWNGGADSAEGQGLAFSRDDDGIAFQAEQVRVARAGIALEAFGAAVAIAPDRRLRSAKIASAAVVVKRAADEPARPANQEPGGAEEPPPPSLHAAAAGKTPAPAAAPPAVPLLPLPDLHALRQRLALAAKVLDERLESASELRVDALSLRVERGDDRLTAGPGALTLQRGPSAYTLEFATSGQTAETSLSAKLEIPVAHGDARLALSGGPVALAPLGIQEGALGLTDVARGTVAGKGDVVLSDAGDRLTFDVDGSARAISIHEPKLASDVVRGLDVGARVRGTLSDQGILQLDDAEATLGALHVLLRGTYEQARDHVSGAFSFSVPTSACQSLLESVPEALLPTLRGARMTGTFGGKGSLAFDSRKLDDLSLVYRFDDLCKLTVVPPELERSRFTRPFTHRVYLPDGTIGEERTGPGMEAWTEIGAISPYMQVAVLTTEDAAFFRHHGFNHSAIRLSLIANLKARRFVRGASTISMQLAKNLFLTREKTLSRKFEELILTSYLEQNFSKEEIVELYFNVIEFGPNVYGITRAADHYFGRRPDELNLPEAFFLSSLLPRPLSSHKMYERGTISDAWARNIRFLMETAHKRGTISTAELHEGLSETVAFHKEDAPRPPPRPPITGARFFGEDEWHPTP